MKNLKNLGKTLNKNEQKAINGGLLIPIPGGGCSSCFINTCLFFGEVCSGASLTPGQCSALGGVFCFE